MARLEDMPPELMKMISDELDFGSQMSLTLASKTIFSLLPLVPATNKAAWTQFNLGFEQRVPRCRALTCLTCVDCGKLLPIEKFSDSQRKKTNPSRFCIRCGIKRHKGFAFKLFRVGGAPMFGCSGCLKAIPEKEAAQYAGFVKRQERWCKRCFRAIHAFLTERKTRRVIIR